MKNITHTDVRFAVAKSGGAGGQNVNKRNTKAVLYFHISSSDKLNEDEKKLLLIHTKTDNHFLKKMWNRINSSGDIVIESTGHRSLEQNKDRALRILNEELEQSLHQDEKRITKTPKKVIRKRKVQAKKDQLVKYKKKRLEK